MSFFGKTPKRNEFKDEGSEANDSALDSPSDSINKTRQVINLDDVEVVPADNDAPAKPAIDLPEGGRIVPTLAGKLKPHQVHFHVLACVAKTRRTGDFHHKFPLTHPWQIIIMYHHSALQLKSAKSSKKWELF